MIIRKFSCTSFATASLLMTPLAISVAWAQQPTPLPEIQVSPPPSLRLDSGNTQSGKGTGPNDNKGDGGAFDRLNKDLKRKVDEVNPILNTPPIDARSSDPKTGVINIPGVQQQYGKNFGHSVYPYRPSVIYSAPLGRR
jgi:hypothetical protein